MNRCSCLSSGCLWAGVLGFEYRLGQGFCFPPQRSCWLWNSQNLLFSGIGGCFPKCVTAGAWRQLAYLNVVKKFRLQLPCHVSAGSMCKCERYSAVQKCTDVGTCLEWRSAGTFCCPAWKSSKSTVGLSFEITWALCSCICNAEETEEIERVANYLLFRSVRNEKASHNRTYFVLLHLLPRMATWLQWGNRACV